MMTSLSQWSSGLQSLSRRGLHGTALEVSKLLLTLDNRDPTGIIFCINYFAIRAHDYGFVQVCPSWSRQNSKLCAKGLAFDCRDSLYNASSYAGYPEFCSPLSKFLPGMLLAPCQPYKIFLALPQQQKRLLSLDARL